MIAQAPKPASQPAAAGPAHAHAVIKGDGISGTADFTEHATGTGKMVDITVTVSGLKPGMHGVHLHAVGKCEPDFTAAGGHFDPGPAGNTDPDANHPFHMGDIPNLQVGANGRGTMKISTTRAGFGTSGASCSIVRTFASMRTEPLIEDHAG